MCTHTQLSLNVPHPSCSACPSNPSSRALSGVVMPALGCSLIAPQRPSAPGAWLALLICFFAKTHRTSFSCASMPSIQGLCWEHSHIVPRPHPTHTTRKPLFPESCRRAWDPVGAWGTLTGPWESKTGLRTRGPNPTVGDSPWPWPAVFFHHSSESPGSERLACVWFRKFSSMSGEWRGRLLFFRTFSSFALPIFKS